MFNDREFIEKKEWPLMDICCLKNYHKVEIGHPPKFGFIRITEPTKVLDGKFVSPGVYEDVSVIDEYESIDKMLEDGWIVD